MVKGHKFLTLIIIDGGSGYCKFGRSKNDSPSGQSATFLEFGNIEIPIYARLQQFFVTIFNRMQVKPSMQPIVVSLYFSAILMRRCKRTTLPSYRSTLFVPWFEKASASSAKALSATERGPHRLGTSLPGERLLLMTMSDAGAGTSRGGSQGGQGQQADPGRKYGIMVNNNINHWKCIFCNKVLTAGVSRLKQHLVGGNKNAKKCPVCPEHVRAELGNYMAVRAAERAAQSMRYEAAVNEDDVEEVDGDQPVRKAAKRKNRGPLDKFVMSLPPDILKGRKDRKAVFGASDKDLRDIVCGGIARWFYDAGIAFNAASHDSFKQMTNLIGQYGMGLKPPSMYELRFPLLQNEVANVEAELVPNREEWAVKGCSIMSDGWRDSVVQKDIVNFLVNSPKGSVFIRSKEVSEVVKDATLALWRRGARR
ncbi:hypothetical protein IGI04_040686 [Brassica rapa subsp. trilocularis]|uniref:BED-type domain-containing protein n=1 Tax=Brassica rapa subsp. trilocularis TaxID=1813537 RepID=A0ABQ7KRH7_BRACM|nr:hypothetical protein IGI04_040686 [Brassica rapa subsp. trilocularis]